MNTNHKNFASALALMASLLMAQSSWAQSFNAGDLVISYVQNQVTPLISGSALDTASPIFLKQFQLGAGGTSATADGTFTLPQMASGSNAAISGEFGSASEGILENSADGHYLTIMGYGVNAAAFNTSPSSYGTVGSAGFAALGQTTSQAGGSFTLVPRVAALISADGSVDTSTALTGVFNMNNPRSAATVNGSSFYLSGQGVTGDGTGGIFYATKGATTATAINNNTAPSPSGTGNPAVATETRAVEIVNTGSGNTLMASRDFKVSGTPNDATDLRSFTSSGGLPTSATGLTVNRVIASGTSTGGNTSSIDVTNATDNGVNHSRNGQAAGHSGNTYVYLSPEQFYYANASTLYIADTGSPKNGSATSAGLGEGGLQKWINSATDGSGTWTLAYDMFNGLNLVGQAGANSTTPTADGVTGLFGLAGMVVGGNVELFATSYGLNELSQSYLYEITDSLAAATMPMGEQFTTLYTDSSQQTLIRGVAFAPVAPVPEPSTLGLIAMAGVGMLALLRRRVVA